MVYENKKIVAISKPISDYKKVYVICVCSSNFWVIYDETDSYWRAKDIVSELENDNNECIIIWTKRKGLK